MANKSIIFQYVVISDGLVKPYFTDSYQDALNVLHSQYLVNKAERAARPYGALTVPNLELRIHWKPEISLDEIVSSVRLSYDIYSLNLSIIHHLHDYIENFKL